MMVRVVIDLRIFFIFYLSFIYIGALIFDVIGPNPQADFRKVGSFAGNFLFTIKLTLGNMSFDILNDE